MKETGFPVLVTGIHATVFLQNWPVLLSYLLKIDKWKKSREYY